MLLLRFALGATLLLGGLDAPTTPSPSRFGALPVIPHDEAAQIGRRAPSYAGHWVNGDRLVVAVTSEDETERASALRELLRASGRDLAAAGIDTENVSFARVKYSAVELSQVWHVAARTLRGWTTMGVEATRNKLVVRLSLPSHKAHAERVLRAAGLPLDAVLLLVPPAPTLPPKTTLAAPHTSRFVVPAAAQLGDLLPISLEFKNTARSRLTYGYGACSFDWEIRNAVNGRVVRPIPAKSVCPAIGLSVTLGPGEATNLLKPIWGHVQPLAWDLRDEEGRFVPPGEYVLRGAFGDGDFAIRPADVRFTVKPAASDGGTERAYQRLWSVNALGEALRETRLIREDGRQLVEVTVPDVRAKHAVAELARKEGVSLARVRFVVLGAPPLPPIGTAATLKVTSDRAGEFSFELNFAHESARTVLAGALTCEAVFVVRRGGTNEVVSFAPMFPVGEVRPCPTGATLHHGLHGQWNGRLTDGILAPSGAYEVRAGLRVTKKGGAVAWLSAPPATIAVK